MPKDKSDNPSETAQIAAQEAAKIAAQEAETFRKFEDAKIREDLDRARGAQIKAEAERDIMQKVMEMNRQGNSPVVIPEEQWESLGVKMGMSKEAAKEQIMTNAQIAQQMVDATAKKFDEKLSAAEKRAAAAEEKANRAELSRAVDRTKAEFYAQKPALARHGKDVDEFLDMFPDSDKNDPNKLKVILAKAEIYVKGKVGGQMDKRPGGSPSFERDDGAETGAGDEEIAAHTFGAHEQTFVAAGKGALARSAELKEFENTRGRDGVELSGVKEWEAVRKSYQEQFRK